MRTNGTWTRRGTTIVIDLGSPAALRDSLESELESGQPTLRQGSQGSAVSTLQARLAALRFSPGPIDGKFGTLTGSAVRAFQTSRRLQVDGIVGPQTWAALGTQRAPAPSKPPKRPLPTSYVPAPPAGQPGSPSGGVSGTAPQLAQQILNHPNIALTGRCVRDDITRTTQGQPGTAGTSLSARMLSDLLDLASSQKVIVTAIESGGTGHGLDQVAGGKSNHYSGTAFDVVPDPPSVTGLQSIAKTAYDRRGAWAIHELIFSPMASGTTTLYNGLPHTYKAETMNAHKDHVHLSVK